jgi:hypothetical protein
MIHFRQPDQTADINGREQLHRRLAATVEQPTILSRTEYLGLSGPGRDCYDRARVLYLSGGILVNTPALRAAKKTLRRLLGENLGRNSGHTGLMLSGDSTLGKTTIAESLMKYVFRSYRSQFPDFEGEGRVPVVSVEVPAGCTGKLLMIAFARFFGLSIARTETADSIRNRVVQALNAAGTQLVVVDELHNLTAANRGNGESVDILKALHNQVPATFLYAGIDLDNGALLGGSRGQQLSARFARTDLTRFNHSDPDRAAEWYNIVGTFEKSLCLADHEAGSLREMSRYLHERTNGSIGSLGRLLAGTAIELIVDPDGRPEALTKELLDDQTLDMAAETAYASRPISKKTKAIAA